MTRDPMRTELWLIVGYNLMLLLQVFVFGIPAGNILLIFWAENVLLGVVALFSLLRARRGGDVDYEQFRWDQTNPINMARWPALWVFGYGMFTGVALVFIFPLAYGMGVELTAVALGVPLVLAIGRETGSALQSWWLPADQRLLADRRIVADAKTRMIVLHLVVVLGWGLTMAVAPLLRNLLTSPDQLLKVPFVVLVLAKTIGEIISVRRARRITHESHEQGVQPRPNTNGERAGKQPA